MATKEELSVIVGMLRSEMQAMEARHTSRLQLVENEVVILQGKIKDKDTNGGRDLFIVKKGFGSLPLFDGRVDKYEGPSKGEWEDPSKGSWSKSSWKGKGNPWGSRKGTYWFDQTNCSSSDGDRAWAPEQLRTTVSF